MEKMVMELCEAAKKEAEAVKTTSSNTKEARCLAAPNQIKNSDITSQFLVSTQFVEHLLPLTKHPRKKIQDFASSLVASWRNEFPEQIRDEKNGSYTETTKIKNIVDNKISDVQIVKVQKVDGNDAPTSKKMVRSESVVTTKKSNFVRKKLCYEEIRDEVKACDPVEVDVPMESATFERGFTALPSSSQTTWEEVIKASGDGILKAAYLEGQVTDALNRAKDLESKMLVASDSQQEAMRLKREAEIRLLKIKKKTFRVPIRADILGRQVQSLEGKVNSLEAEVEAANDDCYREYLNGIYQCKIKISEHFPQRDLSFVDDFLKKARGDEEGKQGDRNLHVVPPLV